MYGKFSMVDTDLGETGYWDVEGCADFFGAGSFVDGDNYNFCVDLYFLESFEDSGKGASGTEDIINNGDTVALFETIDI